MPLDDLQGVLSLRFTLVNPGTSDPKPNSDTPSGLIPGHKQSIVLFLERVYGIETQELFFRILEEAFLPDLRAATMLDRVSNCFIIKHFFDSIKFSMNLCNSIIEPTRYFRPTAMSQIWLWL